MLGRNYVKSGPEGDITKFPNLLYPCHKALIGLSFCLGAGFENHGQSRVINMLIEARRAAYWIGERFDWSRRTVLMCSPRRCRFIHLTGRQELRERLMGVGMKAARHARSNHFGCFSIVKKGLPLGGFKLRESQLYGVITWRAVAARAPGP
jgi:hypothetical protein